MRGVFSEKVQDARVSISEGYFDHVQVEDSWADIIVIAQAFHWCADYDKAVQEFNRILKPHGTLALIWNLEDREAAQWVAQLRDAVEQHELGTPQFRLGLWRQLYAAPSFLDYFNTAEETSWSYCIPNSVVTVIYRVLTQSYIAVLPNDEKDKVVQDIKVILEEGRDLVWRDRSQHVLEYPYTTLVVTATKK